MLARTIELQNADGSLCRWICRPEADRLAKQGDASRVTAKRVAKAVYRLHPVAEPSSSRDTSASITTSDMKALAGLQRVDEIWIERLIGFNLVPANTPLPASGYLL